ncbi:MAG: hypothetical protein FIB08_12075 [Candidatus Methanoperedens sp.]|nr:hypothetical protein [Candidatus Methanoperedens sp.]
MDELGMIFLKKVDKVRPDIDTEIRKLIKMELRLYFSFLREIPFSRSSEIGLLVGYYQSFLNNIFDKPHTLKEIKAIIQYDGNEKAFRKEIKILFDETIPPRKRYERGRWYRLKDTNRLEREANEIRQRYEAEARGKFKLKFGFETESIEKIIKQLIENGEVKVPTEEEFKAQFVKIFT